MQLPYSAHSFRLALLLIQVQQSSFYTCPMDTEHHFLKPRKWVCSYLWWPAHIIYSWWGSIKSDLQLPPLTMLCFACSILCLTKAKVLLPSRTHSPPSPTEAFPWVPCLSEAKNLQQLLAFIQQESEGKCTHQGAQEVPLTATVGVCMCEHMTACVCIVHECVRTMLTR